MLKVSDELNKLFNKMESVGYFSLTEDEQARLEYLLWHGGDNIGTVN